MATGVLRSKVAGVKATNSDGVSRQKVIAGFVRRGKKLEAVREPDNSHDPNAIGLWVSGRWLWLVPFRHQVGYIGAHLSEELARHMDSGGTLYVWVTEVTGDRTSGVNIEIRKHG